MSGLNVTEKWSGRAASGDGVSRSAIRVLQVEMSSASDTPVDAQLATGVPRKGEPYPGDPFLRCEAPPSVRSISPTLYEVTASYASATGSDVDQQGRDNPRSRRATIRWSFAQSEVEVDEDADGKTITNVNGETFHEPISRRQNDPVLTITRNEGTFNYRRAIQYMAKGGATNSDTFFGAKPGMARIESITSDARQYESGVSFDPVTYEIHFREDGWKRRVLNQGFYRRMTEDEIHASTPEVEAAGPWAPDGTLLTKVRSKGQAVTKPVLLGEDGFLLGKGKAAHWLKIKLHPSKSFRRLRLQ